MISTASSAAAPPAAVRPPEDPVQPLLVDRPTLARARLVLAHGAGAAIDAPFLSQIAAGLATRGVEVVRFEFPYMHKRRETGKRAPPDRMPVLEAAFRAVIERVRDRLPLFLGGKSMGGRVATHIADALAVVQGVVVLGYPFHPPQQPQKQRVEHLRTLATPCLIVQGTRDPLGTADEVPGYALSENIRVHWLADGDHSFAPRKASGHTLAGHMDAAIEVCAGFILERCRA
jgi:predicted alpha/beta-hydrolase family hydrolase